MEKKITKLEQSKIEVIVSVEKDIWAKAQKDSFSKLAADVEIKGFRKGKAPAEMIKAKVDQGQVFDRAINSILQDTYRQIISEENLRPYARPVVDVTKLSDLELELKFTLVLAPEVTLGEYKGLHAEKKEAVVTDHEISHAIEHLVADNASLVVKEDAAVLGDTVVMDFEGFVDGKPFEGGKAENHSLELGSGQFIPGFEDALVGAKAGDEKDINVKFPTEYVPELADKDATFKVKVHEVKVKKVPELNEDLIKDLNLPNVKTVEDLKAHQKAKLESQKANDVKRDYYEAIVKQIRDNAKIDIAKEIIDGEVEAMEENMLKQIEQQGLTMEKYLQITGQSSEKLHEQMAKEAEDNIRSVLVLEKIAEVENIKVEDDEIEFELAKIADQYKMPLEEVKKVLKDSMDRFSADVRSRRIQEFIVNNND
ncbi:MAG: trigger factor [Bacilli bacterium]|jgi:trigger factor|nr:trigger factor [Bacilli bacterium]